MRGKGNSKWRSSTPYSEASLCNARMMTQQNCASLCSQPVACRHGELCDEREGELQVVELVLAWRRAKDVSHAGQEENH